MSIKDTYYSVKQIVKLFGVSDETVYRAIRSGRLPARKFGSVWRVAESDLKVFLKA